MKTLIVVVAIFLTAHAASIAPLAWGKDPLLNSCEHKAVYLPYWGQKSPGVVSSSTTFYTAFNSAPRVIIALTGFQQLPYSGSDVGFKPYISAVSSTTFTNTFTIYGTSMSYLIYFSLAISYSATEYHLDYQCLDFSSSDNLVNTAAASRSTQLTLNNVADEDYSAVFGKDQIVMLIYLGGYKTNIGTTGIHVKVSVKPVSGTTHEVTFETDGDAQVSQITYFRMSFNHDNLALFTYPVVFDTWIYSGANSTQIDPASSLNVNYFQYRNYLMGLRAVVFSYALASATISFMLDLRGTTDFFWFPDSMNQPSYTYLEGDVFHSRVPTCNATYPLYCTSDQRCYDSCAARHFQPSGFDVCKPCHSSCLTCSSTYSDGCMTCDSASDFREMLNSSAVTSECVCVSSYYENPTDSLCHDCTESIPGCSSCIYSTDNSRVECMSCDPQCLTCAAPSFCYTCDTTIRTLVVDNSAATSTCSCLNGGISMSDGSCEPAASNCGNGIVESGEVCDDGNSDSEDGCSSGCKVESDHTCTTYTNGNGTSLCYYSSSIALSIKQVVKLLNANKVEVLMDVSASNCNSARLNSYFKGMSALQLTSSRRLVQQEDIAWRMGLLRLASTSIKIISASYSARGSGRGTVELILEYFEDIYALSSRKFTFLQSQNESGEQRYFYQTPQVSVALQEPYNNVPLIYYESSTYSSVSSLSRFFLALIVLMWVFLLLFAIFRRTVIPVEAMLVVQFAYFGVYAQSQVQIGLTSLAYYGRFSYGINLSIIQDQLYLCDTMGNLYQQCNAINNINLTFFIATFALLLAFAIQLYKDYNQRVLDNQSNYHSTSSGGSGGESEGESQIRDDAFKAMKDSTYELPSRVRLLSEICLEIAFAVYFLTAVEYLLTAVNQDRVAKAGSVALLALMGLAFVGIWAGWFRFYPISGLSFTKVAPATLEKISIFKFHYLGMFVFLIFWGLMLAVAPPLLVYILAILWAVFWSYLTLCKAIYKNRLIKIRSLINQTIIIIIAIFYIVMEYADVGSGVAMCVIVAVLLMFCLAANLAAALYCWYLERQASDLVEKNDEELRRYASNSEKSDRTDNRAANFAEMSTVRKPMLESQMRSVVENKIRELKTIRKQMKISPTSSTPDESKRKEADVEAEREHLDKNKIIDQYDI